MNHQWLLTLIPCTMGCWELYYKMAECLQWNFNFPPNIAIWSIYKLFLLFYGNSSAIIKPCGCWAPVWRPPGRHLHTTAAVCRPTHCTYSSVYCPSYTMLSIWQQILSGTYRLNSYFASRFGEQDRGIDQAYLYRAEGARTVWYWFSLYLGTRGGI